MRRTSIFLSKSAAAIALHCLLAAPSALAETQAGEDQWVPSLAITSGVAVQKIDGFVDSVTFEDKTRPPVPLRGFLSGDDIAVEPFVGASLELMSPALDLPGRPRFFVSADFLPVFAQKRTLAQEGNPDCVRGSEPDAICAQDEDGSRNRLFDSGGAKGQGSETTAEYDQWMFGASVGVAFPVEYRERQLRIKPLFGWINYKVDAEGVVVDALCPFPPARPACTDYNPTGNAVLPGFLRETTLTGSDSSRFNAIGGGLDIEMDIIRWGPVGTALFAGGRAYRVVGDRKIEFFAAQEYDDLAGNDVNAARFEVEVDEWIYRAGIGIRFQWLGEE